jgi:hypothetical protein
MPVDFLTLPDELQGLANSLLEELERRGYRINTEPNPLELPATPTIRATRRHETHFFLVRQDVSEEESQQWLRYARSCAADTRLTICCPDTLQLNATRIANLNNFGIGIIVRAANGFLPTSEARDLAFHAQAPDRASLKPRVRELLGESLDRFERGDWRPAFEDACGVLEEECRAYLVRNLRMGRVKYQSGNKIKILTKKDIGKMTLGALKDTFCSMVSQNQIEANLCSALTKLNPDRVRRAHFRGKRQSDAAIRKRAGTNFWLISNALSWLV